MTTELISLFDRDLSRLQKEIEAFRTEENIWKTAGAAPNAAGNLCLHLAGNLQTYIGKNLGGIAYERNREAEFALKGVARAALLQQIEATKRSVQAALESLTPEALQQNYPEKALGYDMSTQFFLIHLAAHLSYHLGQINYLRRILEQ